MGKTDKDGLGPKERAMTGASAMGDPTSAGALRVITISLQLTVVFAALSLATYVLAERLDTVFAVACSVLFAIGTLLLALGFWNGIQRSRVDEVTLTGLVAVDSSHVPASARNKLWGAIVLQLVIGVLFGSLRPFTQQAFGLLVPTLGLGFATLWGSRFAAFHQRDER